jgi:plasmid maintenance system antidote protein VapI
MTDQDIDIIKKTVRHTLIEFFTKKTIAQTDAAEFLGVSPRTINNMIRDGRLKKTDGKILREDLVKFL